MWKIELDLQLCVKVSLVPESVWWLKGGQEARREQGSSEPSQGIYQGRGCLRTTPVKPGERPLVLGHL